MQSVMCVTAAPGVASLIPARFHTFAEFDHEITSVAILSPSPTGLRSAVGNMYGYRCESDCRSSGREFEPGQVPYFRGD